MVNKNRNPPTKQNPEKRKNVAAWPIPLRNALEQVDMSRTHPQSTIDAIELAVSVATAAT